MISSCGRVVILLAIIALTGCAKTNLTGSLMPGAKLSGGQVFYVEKFAPDNRGLEQVIRDELVALGHKASAGPEGTVSESADVIVTYQDRWMWDITMYLLQLDIQMKDPKTKRVIATGQSYRTSLARKSPAEMAREVLEKIFASGN